MRKLNYLGILLMIFGLNSCEQPNPNFQAEMNNADYLHRSMKQLTDVIVHDIFSPPVASRIYSYSSLAAYEVMAQEEGSPYQSMAGQLNEFEPIPTPPADQEICYPLASIKAFLICGKQLIFSENMIDEFEAELMAEFEAKNIPSRVFENSLIYADSVAKHILAYAGSDNYKETRTFPKYTVRTEDASRWKPTPPDYMEGIEPHWNKIRTFVLDSAQQFVPAPPTAFDLDKNSAFYKEVLEVYEISQNIDSADLAIAKFWDCNPFVSTHVGHVMYATKKITPGGHWINIASIAAKKDSADFAKSAATYALTSLALADGFISCWDEKYRSELVRPETVINEYIDEDWLPVLQTPPFPEYTSGHSVISAAAATALTSIYGEPFPFDDTSEEEYGLPMRSFDSFFDASEEAAISRIYGGIHYRPACEVGVTQGKNVGKFIIDHIDLQSSGISENK